MPSTFLLRFEWIKRTLNFRFDAGTSRGVLKTRPVYWIKAFDPQQPKRVGWGEAAPLVKLSLDDIPDFELLLEKELSRLQGINFENDAELVLLHLKKIVSPKLPSVRFGLETAVLDFLNGGKKRILPNPFFDENQPIPINGLIWMGDPEFMASQIEEKIDQGFDCIKMKIGAIDFEQELALLEYIRSRFSKEEMTLRVDANGAFSVAEAKIKLAELAKLDIHSIEQPIPAGKIKEMAELCKGTPLPIALDEELIGVIEKAELLDSIAPQHIILKPTLLGGILETREWIRLAEERNIGWWMTSALESNIGLNAIAQLASSLIPTIPQGLGTGKLFHNNLESPLVIESGTISYHSDLDWENPS
ncbi:o-succinylbenzoate synthase [Algoriphagus marinus]|uniref:o-succinylbenzoate synthase n=1 Tax=Algoriphagus marinus TaxID=1925762 RepID=UPI00094BB6EB|nr:o-succinylbenzoate synthase [Algoriphagus marinus]